MTDEERNRHRSQTVMQINEKFFQGIMAPSWYVEIEDFFDKYEFEDDVMIALFQECSIRKGLAKPYIKKVAENWYNAGIKTMEEYEIYKRNWKVSKKTYKPEFTDRELKLIYHAMLEIKGCDSLQYVDSDELELIALVRKKIEKLIF